MHVAIDRHMLLNEDFTHTKPEEIEITNGQGEQIEQGVTQDKKIIFYYDVFNQEDTEYNLLMTINGKTAARLTYDAIVSFDIIATN